MKNVRIRLITMKTTHTLKRKIKKNWSRFVHINTAEQWDDWYSLASEYENKEKEENKKKYKKPKKIIRKKKN